MTRVSQTGQDILNDRVGTRKGYTGHLNDTAADLVYMKARYYDPQIGRFYSNDPVGFSVGNPMMFNRYGYANDNPYRYIDPDGRLSYLVSRPLEISDKFNHNFIVHHAEYLGDPNARVRSFGDVGDDTTGEVNEDTEGFSNGTKATDKYRWESLSEGDNSGVTFRPIDATDEKVESLADGVVGGQEYSLKPEWQGGINSNSAAGAVAHRADGGSSHVENGISQPGASVHDRVEINEENDFE